MMVIELDPGAQDCKPRVKSGSTETHTPVAEARRLGKEASSSPTVTLYARRRCRIVLQASRAKPRKKEVTVQI